MSSHDNRFSILAEAENNQQSGARDQKKKKTNPLPIYIWFTFFNRPGQQNCSAGQWRKFACCSAY